MILPGVRQLASSYELVWAWTSRLVRARYQQSLLGGAWAILQPAATVAVFSVIFTLFVPVDTKGIPYVLFSYVAVAPWGLFSAAISDMAECLAGNMNLVTKIYFPREILPISALLARVFDYLISFSLVIVLIIVYQTPVFLAGWLLIPVILFIQLILTLGIGLFGAALDVFYRDVRRLFALGLQIWLYASPVLYPVSSVPERFRSIYYLNPMVGIIEAYRDVILHQTMPGASLAISACLAILVLLGGYWFFKRVESQFADVV